MNYDWIMHSGVKGMKWRKGRKGIIDPSGDVAKEKKAKSEARIDKQKSISLNGTKNKKFETSEKETDDKKAREEMNNTLKSESEKARKEREEAAKKALQTSIASAKSRSSSKKKEEPAQKETTNKKEYYWVSEENLKYVGTSNNAWKQKRG